jgi:hypothetical protein
LIRLRFLTNFTTRISNIINLGFYALTVAFCLLYILTTPRLNIYLVWYLNGKFIFEVFIQTLNLKCDTFFYKMKVRSSPVIKISQKTFLFFSTPSVSFFNDPFDNTSNMFVELKWAYIVFSITFFSLYISFMILVF